MIIIVISMHSYFKKDGRKVNKKKLLKNFSYTKNE